MIIYAIVVAFNGEKWIKKCLDSLKFSDSPVQIIVVDNGSLDETRKIVENEYPQAEYIQLPGNLGFGQANNEGMKLALSHDCDYVFLLNQDAWIETNTIAQLVQIHSQNNQYGILSPMHMNSDLSALDYNFSTYLIPQVCPDLYSDMYVGRIKPVYVLQFVNAAGWLISKACIKKVGLFDPLFYHYGEDKNYCQRVQYHKFEIGVCPGVRMVHDRPGRKGMAQDFAGRSQYLIEVTADLADIRNQDFNKRYKRLQVDYFFTIFKAVCTLNKKQFYMAFSNYKYFKKLKAKLIESRQRNSNGI